MRKVHLSDDGRPLCGNRYYQYVGDSDAFEKAGEKGRCKRCERIFRRIKEVGRK